MTDYERATSKEPSSAEGCIGCFGLVILLAGIAFGPSSVLAAITDDKPRAPVLPLAWAILLTMAAFVAAELVMRQLAGNSEHRISPIQSDPDQASLGSSWKRFSFIPLFLVHGVLVAAGHDWPGTVTPVLASILGVLLALMPLVSAWSGDLPALLGCVTAFTLWAVAAFTTGPGLTTLVGGVLIAALAGAARLRARSSPSHPADERASNDGPGHDGDDAQQRGGDE